jgi:putative transposase
MEKKHRRSFRLKDYDYSQGGAYFVTICAFNRKCILGDIINSGIRLSPLGKIIQMEWCNMPKRFPNVQSDVFTIIPNHLHGIMIIDVENRRSNLHGYPNIRRGNPCGYPIERAETSPAPTLGDIIGAFKSLCIHQCRENSLNVGKFWQRNYYEHIIRNENELYRIREYIQNNPLKWELDRENPQSKNFNLDHDTYWKEIYGQ